MAVAYDANSASSAGTGTLSWTHTPVGTPRGVLVLIAQQTGTSDEVTGVTYGGEAMTEVALSPVVKSGGETGVVYGYFLGGSIPTGEQTVEVSVSGSSDKRAVCYTVTGLRDTEVVDTATLVSNSVSNPNVELSLDNRLAFLAGVNLSGRDSPGLISPSSSYGNTSDLEHDFGTQTGSWNRRTSSGKDFTSGTAHRIAWNASADDANILAVAVAEVAQPPAFDAGSHQNGTGTLSWTHTPVGTPRGVLVLIAHAGTSDEVSGVTYGGEAMAEVALSPTLGSVSGGAVYGYFLGSGIPTGAQTVEVSVSGSSDKFAVCFTVTAEDDTAVADTSNLDGFSAAGTHTVDLTLPSGVRCLAFGGLFHGYPTASTVSSGDDVSTFEEYVFGSSGVGSWVVGVRDETGPGTYSVEWTTTQSSYKQALAVAISVELPAEQPLSPDGIASSAAFGAPSLTAPISPAGLAPTAAIGTPTLTVELPLSPEGIVSTSAVGDPAVAVVVTPSAIASTSALGSPTLASSLSAAGVAPTTATGTVSLAVPVTPSGLASTAASGTPTLALPLSPEGIAATTALGTPTLAAALTVTGIAPTAAPGEAHLTATLSPTGLASTAAFGAPTLAAPLTVAGLASTLAAGEPAVAVAFAPAGLASTAAFGTPSFTVTLAPASLAPATAFGEPTLATPLTVTSIASTAQLGAVAMAVGLVPMGVAPTSVFGAPTLATPIAPIGLSSGAALGEPAVALVLTATGIAAGAALGTPALPGFKPSTIKTVIVHPWSGTGLVPNWSATSEHIHPWSAAATVPSWSADAIVVRWRATGRRP